MQSVLIPLFTGLVCLYLGHRIRLGSEAALRRENRRRDFCNAILPILIRLDDANHLTRFRIFTETLSQVKFECLKIEKDIRFKDRRSFRRLAESYWNIAKSDLQPASPSPAATREEMSARKLKLEQAKKLLHERLEAMVQLAQ